MLSILVAAVLVVGTIQVALNKDNTLLFRIGFFINLGFFVLYIIFMLWYKANLFGLDLFPVINFDHPGEGSFPYGFPPRYNQWIRVFLFFHGLLFFLSLYYYANLSSKTQFWTDMVMLLLFTTVLLLFVKGVYKTRNVLSLDEFESNMRLLIRVRRNPNDPDISNDLRQSATDFMNRINTNEPLLAEQAGLEMNEIPPPQRYRVVQNPGGALMIGTQQ